MGLLDGLLQNLDLGALAGKMGVTPDQVQDLVAGLGDNADIGTLIQKAQDMGLPVDKVQEMLGGSAGDLLGKAGDLFGQGGGGLGDIIGGFLGKK